MSTNHCFMVGAERSGTTLLRLMLDGHKDIHAPSELNFLVTMIDDNGKFPEVSEYWKWLESSRDFGMTRLPIDRSLGFVDLLDSFVVGNTDKDQKQICSGVVHLNFDRLRYVWPKARYIHIVRDPRDVAPSCIKMGWAGNTWVAVNKWIEAERLWDSFKEQLDPSQYIEIMYEDLLRDSDKVLAKVCEFLNIPFDEAMYKYVETSTYDLPNPSRAENWRRRASESDIQQIEAKCGELIVDRGYQLSDLPALDVTPRMAAALEAESRRYCRQFRIKRYGLFTVLGEKVTRRLPAKPFHKYFRKRIISSATNYLK